MELESCKSDDGNLTDPTGPATENRLAYLLRLNAESEGRRKLYPSTDVEIETLAMRHPLTTRQSFTFYGLMLGGLFPISVLSRFFDRKFPIAILVAATLCIAVGSVAGFYGGRLVAQMVDSVSPRGFHRKLVVLIMTGFLWGGVAGGMSGACLFIFGAIFGTVLGGVAGAVALPLFAFPYYWLRQGGVIDRRHFLPLALGITVSICSFVIGLGHH